MTVQTQWKDDGRVAFIAGREERDEVSYNASVAEWAGRWNHYVFVKDADEGYQRIYLNGRLVAEKTDSRSSMGGVETARIGIAPDRFGDQYIGKLDDIRIYDRALPVEQIRQLY
ncbi:MAG: LamG-like jellyroll fold domain-containing protein [Planctomycetota bacterium]